MQSMKNEINLAIKAFEENRLVAIPTETVYGLAAPINDEKLLRKIFELKQRPFFDPLIVHVSNLNQVNTLTDSFDVVVKKLADAFWPGPLTFVLPKKSSVNNLITSGLDTVGIRMPNNTTTLTFIETLNIPLAAPSANLFGKTSPTNSEHVKKYFNDQDVFILEDKSSEVGVESTILKIEKIDEKYNLNILRKGLIVQSQIEHVFKENNINYTFSVGSFSLEAPGMLDSHYAPKKPLLLSRKKFAEVKKIAKRDYSINLENNYSFLELSKSPVLAARELYLKMHELSEKNDIDFIVCILNEVENEELFEAVLDRLNKAASFWI